MREIKFRAFSTEEEDYINPSNLVLRLDGYLFDREFDIELNDVILEQFTGLKDKNGVDIYEGDIVIDRYQTKGIVEYFNKYGGYCSHQKFSNPERDGFIQLDIGRFKYEVIGNIHQNKHNEKQP